MQSRFYHKLQQSLTYNLRIISLLGNAEVKLDKEKKREIRRRMKKNPNSRPNDHWKWARRRTAMLISGGNDAKLFTYPANAFLSFHPHDICPCPERPFIRLAAQSAIYGGTLMMVQHSSRVDIWKIHSKDSGYYSNGSNSGNGNSVLGKRKWEGDSDDDSSVQEPMRNGHSNGDSNGYSNGDSNGHSVIHSNGQSPAQNGLRKLPGNSLGKFLGKLLGKSPGTAPALLATIKINSSEHIVCSAISGDGRLVAFADSRRPRLYELGLKMGEGERESVHIKRRKLPAVLKAAHSMVFSADCSRLLVAGPQGLIWVRLLDFVRFPIASQLVLLYFGNTCFKLSNGSGCSFLSITVYSDGYMHGSRSLE